MLYNSGPWILVCIVEVSVIGGVRFWRFHCITIVPSYTRKYHEFVAVCIVTNAQPTMPTATNEWYFPVYLGAMVIMIYHMNLQFHCTFRRDLQYLIMWLAVPDHVTCSTWSCDLQHVTLSQWFLHARLEDVTHIHLTHVNVWESMGKSCSCMQFIKSRILLQVTRESVTGTASHVRCIWTCNEIEGSYDYHHSTKLVFCCWHCYSCCALVTIQTATNLWYFFGIASYYGNYNYISSVCVNKKYTPFLHTYKLLGNSLQKTYMVYTKLRKEDVGIRPAQEEQLL